MSTDAAFCSVFSLTCETATDPGDFLNSSILSLLYFISSSTMSNPRRTPAVSRDGPAATLALKTNLALRKGASFHSPTTPSSSTTDADTCAIFRPPALPRRSQTNLDDVVDAHRRRMRMTLEAFDRTLSTAGVKSQDNNDETAPKTLLDKSFPFPERLQKHSIAMLDEPGKERRVLRPRSSIRRPARHHDSDSGLGTSIVTSKHKADVEATPKKPTKTSSAAPSKASTVTRSAAASTTTLPGLSSRATNKICEHILKPILSKPELKTFHPLVIDCPRRIKEKEILCLRDLEKTLLLIAPVSQPERSFAIRVDTYSALFLQETTKSCGLYLDFCLTTVRCIQATVEYLSDQEQTRPRDPLYSNGYFIDLVDQIQLYARQLAEAKTKSPGEMDVDAYVFSPLFAAHIFPNSRLQANSSLSSDDIKLHGGIHINGRPAELVRIKKNGRAFSLATGEEIDMDEDVKGDIQIKRSASEELADEEEIMRSMARRKKNAHPDEYAPKKCREPGCNKEFKRPCDLTKHEKTHSRPWKCPIKTCKYHEYGWPTEKEMDRHCNDKHNNTPLMFNCLYPPCPYKSKRESNCKQHMEKAHGWQYVRTKTNGGKKSDSKSGSVTHHTPDIRGLPTPISNPPSIGMQTPPRDMYSHPVEFPSLVPAFDFNTVPHPEELQIDPMDYSPEYSPVDNPTPLTDPGLDQSVVNFSDGSPGSADYHWDDIYSANTAQLPAPNPREVAEQFLAFSAAEQSKSRVAPHISPIGQGNAMLFTPNSLAEVDECYENVHVDFNGSADFLLFPPTDEKSMYQQPLFGAEIPSVAAGYSQPNSQEMWGVNWTTPNDYNNFTHHQ